MEKLIHMGGGYSPLRIEADTSTVRLLGAELPGIEMPISRLDKVIAELQELYQRHGAENPQPPASSPRERLEQELAEEEKSAYDRMGMDEPKTLAVTDEAGLMPENPLAAGIAVVTVQHDAGGAIRDFPLPLPGDENADDGTEPDEELKSITKTEGE